MLGDVLFLIVIHLNYFQNGNTLHRLELEPGFRGLEAGVQTTTPPSTRNTLSLPYIWVIL